MTYKRIGIRRDRNLGDLQDKGLSLNNLLSGLVSGSDTFITEDLDAIRNIFAYNLSSDGYREIIGSRVEFTNNDGVDLDFLPRITYQNRLDKLKIFSGVPRINGGNGLTAKYYNKNQVINPIPITGEVFTGTPIKQDNFWEDGNFDYSGKITPEAVDVNGGVEWSGYFIPTTSGSHRFEVRTSALMTFEFETEGYTSGIGTYAEHSRIGLTTTFLGSGDEGNAITLATPSNTKFIGIGQSVSNDEIVVGTLVEGYDTSTGVITLTPPSGSANAITSTITNENITFSKAIGQETRILHTTYALEKQKPYHIRLRYYIPSSFDAINVVRNFLVDIRRPNDPNDDDLRYNYLYASDYDFSQSAKGDFNIFLDNSVLAGGGILGNPASSAGYVKIKSTKKIDIKYEPKKSLAEITKATVTGKTTNNTKVISITDTSGIEIGNFIFGTGIPENTVVDDIIINDFIITSTESTASGSTTLTFIDHRGFVKSGIGSISGTTLTLSSGNTTNLKSKMVVIGNGVTQYTGITTIGFASTVTVSPSQTVAVGTPLYFYQSRGLIDEGLAAFCVPAVTRCIFASSSIVSGSTTLNVVDTTGVAINMRVLGAQFASGTTVLSVNSVAKTINISTATIATILSGGNFTVTSTPAEEGDRSLCCPPTDTSPPFNPTENGLETKNSPEGPSLKINSGNIKFDSLTANVSGIETIFANNLPTEVSDKRLPIQTASGLFNILCA